ncbi:MAG: hypothetical protein CL878_01960 [Dehalococcoidia bacterium]|nr:hypothetical protein [Dehalococcoidia bacterium]
MWHNKEDASVEYLYPREESEVEEATRIAEQKDDFVGAAKFLWPIPDRGLSRRMYRVKTPVLVVWGESDGIIPPVYADEFSNRLRECEALILPESGHLPMLERPQSLSSHVLKYFAPS